MCALLNFTKSIILYKRCSKSIEPLLAKNTLIWKSGILIPFKVTNFADTLLMLKSSYKIECTSLILIPVSFVISQFLEL